MPKNAELPRANKTILRTFLDRTVAVRRHEKPAENTTGIIPGETGERKVTTGVASPLSHHE